MTVMRTFSTKTVTQEQKERVISELKNFLSKQESVLFAYLYGSFLEGEPFRDVDVAAYVDPAAFKTSDEMFNYGLVLTAQVDLAVSGVTVDLRPLNLASTPFRFGVITKGRVIFVRDDQKRIDFETRTRSLYFDFLPHLTLHHRYLLHGE